MEDRNAQPDQVADTGQVNQTALQLEEGRIYISDSMALFQHHGSVQPDVGWLGMGAGFQHLFPVHSPNTTVQVQGGRDGGARLAARDDPT
jgi:hypothetical protein